jgi:hypothetical protein
MPRASVPSPPQKSINNTFAPNSMLSKMKPANTWADYKVPYNPFSLVTYLRQYANTIKGKQACNRFTATIKWLLEPETPFHGPTSTLLTSGVSHPTNFTVPIIKSFLT